METVKKAYNEIFNVLRKYKDICIFDIYDLELKANIHMFGIELKEVYGLNIDAKDINSLTWLRFGSYMSIGWWGEKYNRTISYSSDGRQPKDNLLLEISFSTGAYIFGDDYPSNLFHEFWLELKSFNPDYTDETNHCLFWNIQNAKNIFNSFNDLLNKYNEINKKDFKTRRIEKLKREIDKLENK